MDLTGKQVLGGRTWKKRDCCRSVTKENGLYGLTCLTEMKNSTAVHGKKHILYFRIARCGLENCRMRQYRRWNLQW